MADREMQTGLDDEEQESKPAPEKKRGNGLFVLVGLLVMVVTPAASYFAVRVAQNPSDAKPAAEKAARENPVVMPVDPIVVNISNTRMTRVLRLQAHLVLSEARLEEILRERMPMVKDRVMTTAGQRTLEDLEGLDGRDALKRDIVVEINSMIRDRMAGSVLDVAFSEFLIQ